MKHELKIFYALKRVDMGLSWRASLRAASHYGRRSKGRQIPCNLIDGSIFKAYLLQIWMVEFDELSPFGYSVKRA